MKQICILSLILVISLALSPSRTWEVKGAEAAQKPVTYSFSESPIRPCWPKETHKAGWIPTDSEINEIIPRLIRCESRGNSVQTLDSNNRYSYGILQIQSSTAKAWNEEFGTNLRPMVPDEAIQLSINAIKHGYLSAWSCAYLTGILVR